MSPKKTTQMRESAAKLQELADKWQGLAHSYKKVIAQMDASARDYQEIVKIYQRQIKDLQSEINGKNVKHPSTMN